MPTVTPQQIKAAREAASLSTAQAAALVGVTQRAWQLWESGDRAMKKPMWLLFNHELIARKLKQDPNEPVHGVGHMQGRGAA